MHNMTGCGIESFKNGHAIFTLPCYFVRNLKEEQIQIRFNLVVAIAIAQITFLAGIEASALQVPVQPWSVLLRWL